MITNDLVDYIESAQSKDIPKEAIVAKLVSAGWKIEDVEEGFTKAKPKTPTVQNPIVNNPVSSTAINPVQSVKSSDPYREVPIDTNPVQAPVFNTKIIRQEPAKVWSPQNAVAMKDDTQVDFMPKLSEKPASAPQSQNTPKVVPLSNPINPIVVNKLQGASMNQVPVIMPQSAMLSSFNKDINNSPNNFKQPTSIFKILTWIIIVFAVFALIGGGVYAVMNNYIKIPAFATSSYRAQMEKQMQDIENANAKINELTKKFTENENIAKNLESELALAKDKNIELLANSFYVMSKSFYSSHNKTYTKIPNTSGDCVLPEKGSFFDDGSATNTGISLAIKNIMDLSGNTPICYSTQTAYAIAFPLVSDNSTFYCVDSTGKMMETKTPITKSFCE